MALVSLATAVFATAAAAERPEVVAFYGQDAQPECTPSYWLDFPAGTVTTIIMQGWMDPFMIQYAHAHGMRVLMAGGSCGIECSKLADPAARAQQVNATMHAARSLGLDGVGWDLESAGVAEPAIQSAIALFLADFRAALALGVKVILTPPCIYFISDSLSKIYRGTSE
jgi:hypothetical protein